MTVIAFGHIEFLVGASTRFVVLAKHGGDFSESVGACAEGNSEKRFFNSFAIPSGGCDWFWPMGDKSPKAKWPAPQKLSRMCFLTEGCCFGWGGCLTGLGELSSGVGGCSFVWGGGSSCLE